MGSSYGGTPNSCDSAVRNPLLLISLAFVLLSLLIVVRVLKKRGQAHIGCQLSFLAALWITYLFGPLVYLIPGYCGVFPELEVPGARVCLYGLLGFAAGTLLLPHFFRVRPLKETSAIPEVPARLRNGLLTLGILSFLIARLGAGIASLGAVLTGVQQLMVVAVVLNIWEAALRKQNRQVAFWVCVSFMFPFQTVVNQGFLGFGVQSLAPVLIFVITCVGKRNYFRVGVLSVVGLYLGMSLFVTYMRDRTELRAELTGGSRFSARVERFTQTIENFELFSIHKPPHLDAISGRLNQTWLVGAGVTYIENTREWAHGSTLVDAALGFVPRFLWRDKPVQGGSNMITKYTGIAFSEGTSVPMGQILELYVNFGSWLVFVAYMAIGGLLAYLDVTGRNALKTGAFHIFTNCFLIGRAVQQVGGEFIVATTNVVVGLLLVYGLQMFMRMRTKRAGRMARSRVPYSVSEGYENIPVSRSGIIPN
jgi:hypothetical protein